MTTLEFQYPGAPIPSVPLSSPLHYLWLVSQDALR